MRKIRKKSGEFPRRPRAVIGIVDGEGILSTPQTVFGPLVLISGTHFWYDLERG